MSRGCEGEPDFYRILDQLVSPKPDIMEFIKTRLM